ncbi:MAG: squalene--hopene cyclase [Gloeomargarita sp. SKYG116]|nr:squalene--hopene cyclase [Gloeomargarita sp. SKYG116]MDW8400490.1 squalene--hopene cyclase [Gloeomargarita sp. SKYGB_i_bin116]
MQTVAVDDLQQGIQRSQAYLLSLQYPEGFWWATLESNVTMTAELVLLYAIWGIKERLPLAKIKTYLLNQQRAHGGWELYYGDGGDLNCTIEAYMALRLLGCHPDEPAMQRAREVILSRGGVTRSRIFTKLNLALIGCYEWQGLPSLPPWLMLLPPGGPFSIYDMSSWARSSTVPLIIVFDKKPVYPQGFTLDELYVEPPAARRYELPQKGDWSDVFVWLDWGLKWAEMFGLTPFRQEGLAAAEKWILQRQEETGDWGGIQPAMVNSLLALRCLDYPLEEPAVVRGFRAVEKFCVESETEYWMQPCVSPVWDTALTIRALVDSGLEPDHPALVQAGQWLLQKQILNTYGDWAVKNPQARPGGWAFEFDNRYYPDVDDTAVVVMALSQIRLPNEAEKQQAIRRAVDWIVAMQCKNGSWGAFDKDNDQDWLNYIPYGDLQAMIDPGTADVTARVLEMAHYPGVSPLPPVVKQRALDYLLRVQEPTGSWFGRWGVNYIYGTSGVLAALQDEPQAQRARERAVTWLLAHQNPDGGWGETCHSYNDPSLQGQGDSTVSQTAWAILGLLAAGQGTHPATGRGIAYLLAQQQPNGAWQELWFTGTGFPRHFYLRYNLYYQHFPLMALGRYQRQVGQG